MSDCSTEAMKPKDMDMRKSPNVSKTCGSCGHVYQVVLNCHYAEDDCRYYAHVTRPDARACEHWIPNQDSLEQRYQQLEQVARNMLHEMWSSNRDQSHIPEPRQDDYAEQLIALGVSVDEK